MKRAVLALAGLIIPLLACSVSIYRVTPDAIGDVEARRALNHLFTAETSYHRRHLRYASLGELQRFGVVDFFPVRSEWKGFTYSVGALENKFLITALPTISWKTGRRKFWMNESGEIKSRYLPLAH